MSGMAIVILVSLLAVLDVWRICSSRTSLSRAGLLMAAVVRAVIPLSAAIGIGAVQLIRSFEGIASTGSGGLIVVAVGANELVRTLLIGVIAFVVVLLLALVLVSRNPLIDSDDSARRRTPRRVRAVIGTMAVVGALGSAWVTMHWAEKVSVGIVAPMLRGGVFNPTPDPTLAKAPSAYAGYLKMSGQEAAMESEHLITSRAIGFGLCALFVGLSFATSAVFAGLRSSGAAWQGIRGSVIALVGVAVWYSVRLGTGAGWLRTLIDR